MPQQTFVPLDQQPAEGSVVTFFVRNDESMTS
jgi:hypothetical protein